jgi:subtilisin family serine protease
MKILLTVIAMTTVLPVTIAFAADTEETIPVIVVFQKDTPFQQFRSYAQDDERTRQFPTHWNYLNRGVVGAVQRLEKLHHIKAHHVYSHALNGFSGRFTKNQIELLRSEPTVAYIETDQVVSIDAQVLPWGIDRIEADRSSTLAGNGSGAITNVNAYVIDTGISQHPDLNYGGNVNFAGGVNGDCHGHGTHVAGTIGAYDNSADVVGVAPGIRITGVKVLDCNGSGFNSAVIKGIDWVTANAVKPAVANMSLGGGASQAVDDAVVRSANSGVFYAVAAGNSGTDACTTSPARAGYNNGGVANGIMTTGAFDQDNRAASFSNYGRCVDIWSPGVNVLSTRLNGGLTTMSGTSMASPHTAGAGALYLSRNPRATPQQVEAALKANSVWKWTYSRDARPLELLQVSNF